MAINILVHSDARDYNSFNLQNFVTSLATQFNVMVGYRRGQLTQLFTTYEYIYLWAEGLDGVFFLTKTKSLIDQISQVADNPVLLASLKSVFA